MKSIPLLLLILVLFVAAPLQALGADRYISDVLIVTLRDAPSRTSNIIGHLRSGDYMTVLEEQDNGYLFVRVSSGIEGWVPKKYTAEGKSKDTIIKSLKSSVTSLEASNNSQKSKNSKISGQVNDYQATIDTYATREAGQQARILDLEKQVAEAQDKYITLKDQSEGVEEVFAEQQALVEKNGSLTKELTVLKMENQELDQTRNIFWFLTGAAVLLVGFILGRSGRRSRRNSLSL